MNLVDLVVALDAALSGAGISHAFGGALALAWAGTPRGTVDVDVNVFLPPTEVERVATALAELGLVREGGGGLPIAGIRFSGESTRYRVDVFPSLDPRYQQIERRVIRRPFGHGSAELPFLSAEDLCVFKLSFGRDKDWVDLKDIASARPDLDVDYIEDQVVGLRGPTMYPRLARFRRLLPLR